MWIAVDNPYYVWVAVWLFTISWVITAYPPWVYLPKVESAESPICFIYWVEIMSNKPTSLVFIKTSISNYQHLMEGIDRNSTEIILINGYQDGIEVIADVIEAITNVLVKWDSLQNIQILSHGSEGVLHLGNS